jgi:hypothetical protein
MFKLSQLFLNAEPAAHTPAAVAPTLAVPTLAPAPTQVEQPAPAAAVALPPVVVPPLAVPAVAEPAVLPLPVAEPAATGIDSYLIKAGLTMEHINAEYESFGALSAMTKQLLADAHGDHAGLVEQALENTNMMHKDAVAQATVDVGNQVAELFSVDAKDGAEAFGELVDWFTKQGKSEKAGQYADMIGAGGLSRELAIKAMVGEYKDAEGVQPTPELVEGDSGNTRTVGGLITREEFNKQRFAIEAKHGYESPQMKALQNQRMSAIQQGH